MDVRTAGVEEELLLVDARARPAPVGESVVRTARAAGGSERPPDPVEDMAVEHEFKREQAETGTTPCVDLGEAREQLVALRRQLSAAAAEHGAQVAALGTSPHRVHPAPTDSERYRRMHAEFALVSAQQLTCGQHVHVSIDSPEEGVGVLDRIRPWLALLTAMSANSPYWQGLDSGYASYRTIAWGLWPTAGPTDVFGTPAAYDARVEQLIASGAALDAGMLYFDARLSRTYPTVELRVADVCLDVDDAVLVAALCRALVETAAREWRSGADLPDVPTGVLRAARWRAARHGLSGELVDPVSLRLVPASAAVDALLRHVGPALADAGDDALVHAGVQRLRRVGNGAEAQRRTYAASGRLDEVVRFAVDRTLRA